MSASRNAPFVANADDLSRCLELLGEHPLKLIANRIFEQYNESKWESPVWTFSAENGRVEDKKLLVNSEDTFQLSVANEKSSQDFHRHVNVFDIYVSSFPIRVDYFEEDQKKALRVRSGILIVPPEVYHKVKLNGLTFVFQASMKGHKIQGDKESLSIDDEK